MNRNLNLRNNTDSILIHGPDACANIFDLRPSTYKLGRNKERDFAQDSQSTSDSLESRISAALWEWRFAEASDRDHVIANSQLASMLEFWMPFSEIEVTRKLGTWCDGIPLLQVSNLTRTAFTIAGVGYFPQDLFPFELGFHYKNRRDLSTTKITFKFGILDNSGSLRTFTANTSVHRILSQRPQNIEDWAVAAELTPQA